INPQNMTTVSGKGVTATIDSDQWKIGNARLVGEKEALDFQNNMAATLAEQGKTVVFVKRKEKVIALFALKDTIRTDTKQAIMALKKRHIHTVMLTGDNEVTAKVVAEEIGLDHYIAKCLPEEKVEQIK